jgi:RNA polymerase sigma-70 factor (ECF subfamily)
MFTSFQLSASRWDVDSNYVTIPTLLGREALQSWACMNFSEEDLEKLRPKVRFKVCYDVGFFCPDVDDIVQEALMRFMLAVRADKIHNQDAVGAFLNGICRNVVSEYRRRNMRDEPMPEVVPEPKAKSLAEAELFEMRQAIALGMEQLSDRDRRVLRAFYLEEKSKDEILQQTGMTDENFRVVLCRAKERFRAIYLELTQHRGSSRHLIV